MYLSAMIGEERVSRPYTPISSNDEQGYFELVIKVRSIWELDKGKVNYWYEMLGMDVLPTKRNLFPLTMQASWQVSSWGNSAFYHVSARHG